VFDKNYSLAVKIKNLILRDFPYADINIVYDKGLNEYFISTNDEKLYYSEAYGMLILTINTDILWGQGIFNFYFILDVQEHELGKMTKKITFSPTDEINYKTWFVNEVFFTADKPVEATDSSLAA